MNRHRSAPKTPVSVFVTLAAAAAVAATGGALHAICKNRQVLAERTIDATERRIGQHRLDIQIAEVRMDEMLDRYELKDRLRAAGTRMVEVSHGDVEEVSPLKPSPAVASADLP